MPSRTLARARRRNAAVLAFSAGISALVGAVAVSAFGDLGAAVGLGTLTALATLLVGGFANALSAATG